MSYGRREPREMHKAVCAECGQECEVPFKPDGSRPVYCRECYAKRRPPRRNRYVKRHFRPRFSKKLKAQLSQD